MIPISKVLVDRETEELVLDVLRSGQLAQGPVVAKFEQHCAEMAGTKHAIAVNNGTTALELALHAADVGPGDEVITTPFTFAATVNAIVHSGATVRFADIGPDFCIDPHLVEQAITPRTKAIMPVHLYGLPADMERLTKISERHGITLIEDAAQAHGAKVGEIPVGGYGMATFSFYATKNLSTGEGGVITTNNDAWAERMRIVRNQGMKARYQYLEPGHNYRMMDLVAALAITQFTGRPAMEAARRANAAVLTAGLAEIPGLVTPSEPPGRKSVWHQYTVRITADARVSRDDFVAGMNAAGVGCGVYYPFAAYDYDCFRTHPSLVLDPCPEAEKAALEVASLPVHQHLSDADLQSIIGAACSILA
jgi:perosamine synthetase